MAPCLLRELNCRPLVYDNIQKTPNFHMHAIFKLFTSMKNLWKFCACETFLFSFWTVQYLWDIIMTKIKGDACPQIWGIKSGSAVFCWIQWLDITIYSPHTSIDVSTPPLLGCLFTHLYWGVLHVLGECDCMSIRTSRLVQSHTPIRLHKKTLLLF